MNLPTAFENRPRSCACRTRRVDRSDFAAPNGTTGIVHVHALACCYKYERIE